MYFGEEHVLFTSKVPCRVTVHSPKAILLGFSKNTLLTYMDAGSREDWLKNHMLVKFPHETEVRHDTIIERKLKSI